MKEPDIEDTKRAKERVEKLRKLLARSTASLHAANDLFRYECKTHGWNEDLPFEIDETIGRLGVHLACVTQWFDDEEGAKE